MGTAGRLARLGSMTRSNQKEVLIVEDEAMIRMVAADALADCGIVAWEAGDAEEALDALNHHPSISLLFTDVNMPGDMNGIDLARRVHEVRPDVELIITSGATIIANDRGGSVCLNRLARLLSGGSAGFMPLREAVG